MLRQPARPQFAWKCSQPYGLVPAPGLRADDAVIPISRRPVLHIRNRVMLNRQFESPLSVFQTRLKFATFAMALLGATLVSASSVRAQNQPSRRILFEGITLVPVAEMNSDAFVEVVLDDELLPNASNPDPFLAALFQVDDPS